MSWINDSMHAITTITSMQMSIFMDYITLHFHNIKVANVTSLSFVGTTQKKCCKVSGIACWSVSVFSMGLITISVDALICVGLFKLIPASFSTAEIN